MKTIIIAFRSIFRRGRNGLIRILSLSIGLAMGLALIAKVYFEQSYDNFTPDIERIYRVQMKYKMGEDQQGEALQTSGGVAIGMKDVMPEIEVATRFTYAGIGATFITEDKNTYQGSTILADSSLFDILSRPILAGDPKDVLSRPQYAMVSSGMAETLGGAAAAIGKTFYLESEPRYVMTIGGVFEEIPVNSHVDFDVVLSLPSIKDLMGDGSMNWIGNERYVSYVKLFPGVDPESLREGIERTKEKYLDKALMKQYNIELDFALVPLAGLHTAEVKRSMWMLGILAVALLFTAVMNYLLIVISSLVSRSKEMAVHKCYGASGSNIYSRMMAETLADLLVALAISAALIYTFRGAIVSLLDTASANLFTLQGCALLAGVCLAVFLVSSLVPGYLYSRIPVAAAFRRFSDSKRRWKLGLLFVQFIAAGFFVTLLAVVGKQYYYMTNNDPGYRYENLVYFNLQGVGGEDSKNAVSELLRLPEVESISSADYILINEGFSGNNISLPGGESVIFNTADLYSAGSGYFDVMGIPIIEGRSFTEGTGDSREVMVSRSFVERMKEFTDLSEGIIGQGIHISEHSRTPDAVFTICGVYEDVRLGIIGRAEERPSMLFYNGGTARNIIVKLHGQSPDAMAKINGTLADLFPEKTLNVYSYPSEIVNRYGDSRKFRDSILAAGLATLLISLMGLLGYTNDEMNRRRKEIAIRKINGATIAGIEGLFLSNILRMSLPALILGCAVAWYVSEGWLEKFDDKAGLPFMLFICCGAVVLAVIMATVSINCYRAANENPAVNIKSE